LPTLTKTENEKALSAKGSLKGSAKGSKK